MTDNNPREVDLSPYEEKYLLYRALRAQHEALTKQLENMKKDFKELMGDATVAVISGEVVFTYESTDAFRWKDFAEENPLLARKYTEPKLVDKPNLEALRRDHPALFAQFRSRQFNTKKVV